MITNEAELARQVDKVNNLLLEVRKYKFEHPESRCSYGLNYGSLLNAYREGDISFDECVEKLEAVCERRKQMTTNELRIERHNLELNILELINTFESKTGFIVKAIRIHSTSALNLSEGKGPLITGNNVECEISLP